MALSPDTELEQLRRKLTELERLYQTAPVGLAYLDSGLRYRRINERLAAINSGSVESHLGREIGAVPSELATLIEPDCQEVLRTGQPILDREVEVSTGTGELRRFFRCSYHPVQENGSGPTGISIVVEDITAHNAVVSALRRSEERLQLAIEAHQIDVFECDLDPGGWDPSTSGWLQHVMPDDQPVVTAAIERSIAEKLATVSIGFRMRQPDGPVRWIKSHSRILYNQDGAATRVIGVNVDVTDDRMALEQLRSSEERYHTLFEATSDGILIVNDEGRYIDVNDSYCRILKATKTRLVGAHFSEFIPPERLQEAEFAFSALRLGGSTPVDFPLRALDGTIVDLSWTSSTHYLPGQYFCCCRDISRRKRAEEALRRSEHELRFVLDHAPVLIAYVDSAGRYVRVNRAYEDMWGQPAEKIHGKRIEDVLGVERTAEVRPHLDRALAGENVSFEWRMRTPDGTDRDMAVSYTPDRDERGTVQGFIALSQNVTERKRYEDALRASEAESRRLLAALPDIVSRFDRDFRIVYISPVVERFTGLQPDFFVGKTHSEAGMPAHLAHKLDASLRRVFQSGQQDTIDIDFATPGLGLRHWVGTAIPEPGEDGRVNSVLTMLRDVTEQKIAERNTVLLLSREQEARETAELLNTVGPMLAVELDTQRLARSVTDIASRLTGAEYGAFLNNTASTEGEACVLATSTSQSNDVFCAFLISRRAELFGPEFHSQGVLRSDNIRKDDRYRAAMAGDEPPPVFSYLAAPVLSRSGTLLGGLFFGHSRVAKFTERHEAIVAGIAAQAAIAMDNARLFEEAQWAQNELRKSNEELRRANRDLETFAYSASHDLQEPLRTVVTSAQLFQRAFPGDVQGDAAVFLDGVVTGSLRMQGLIQDLLAYSQATRHEEGPAPAVDSAAILAKVRQDLQTQIEQEGAVVTAADLPTVAMHEVHLTQLLQNLISNALKYRRPVAPQIHISAAERDGYWIFSVADNGIGMDPKYDRQIFGLFKRLHGRSEYPGSGVGLAICLRVVEQYGGRIWLEKSVPGEGSVFSFSIPVQRASE